MSNVRQHLNLEEKNNIEWTKKKPPHLLVLLNKALLNTYILVALKSSYMYTYRSYMYMIDVACYGFSAYFEVRCEWIG